MSPERPGREGRVDIRRLAVDAKLASRRLAAATSTEKNQALLLMADALERRMAEVLQENVQDVAAGRKKPLSAVQIDTLLLDEHRLEVMIRELRSLASMPDPVGEIVRGWITTDGLRIEKRRVPFGVIIVAYEARPSITVDAAALCVKTGNAVILCGGADSFASNRILAEVLTGAVLEAGLPRASIQFLASKDRADLVELLSQEDAVDLVVPRGGDLARFVVENTHIPVITAAGGNCHVYVDRAAELNQALAIAINSKVARPGVPNAAETLLVHEAVAEAFLPRIIKELQDRKVKIYACELTRTILGELGHQLEEATEGHWASEFQAMEMAVKVVKSLAEAVEHIGRYGTGHSEAIITRDLEASTRFLDEVDAAVVYVNASTRFTDGAALGLGGEIGVSTQKLHARGPLALRELTTVKYVITGSGHTR